jgi:hypothetical protein
LATAVRVARSALGFFELNLPRDGQPDLPSGGYAELPSGGQLDYLV